MAHKGLKTTLTVLIAVLLAFIWGNSLLRGEVSGEISGGLLEWLISVFPFLNWLPELVLRKIGHFSEFGALGFLLAWRFTLQGQRGIHRFSVPLLCAMLAAQTDETIQVFVPDRGPSVVDVWIDLAGACTGMAVFFLGSLVTAKIILERKRKQ